MKSRLLPLLATLLSGLPAVAQTTPSQAGPITVIVSHQTAAIATVTLGDPILSTSIVAPFYPLPTLPLTFSRGTHLQIVMPVDGITNPVVTWYKDGQVLTNTGTTLDFPAVATTDTGGYSAAVRDGNSLPVKLSDVARILITATGQAVVNYSTRAEINPTQPYILGGFVVQSAPAQSLVLVRAVGPALAQFGINAPLAAPRLRLRDAKGQEVAQWNSGWIITYPPGPVGPRNLGAAAGAFPLPADSKDIEREYLLPAGAYTAEVSSADGSSGTVLLEVYQVPL